MMSGMLSKRSSGASQMKSRQNLMLSGENKMIFTCCMKPGKLLRMKRTSHAIEKNKLIG